MQPRQQVKCGFFYATLHDVKAEITMNITELNAKEAKERDDKYYFSNTSMIR